MLSCDIVNYPIKHQLERYTIIKVKIIKKIIKTVVIT